MSFVQVAGFAGLAILAAYLQALTGFAFALVMMGGIGLLGLMSLEDAAIVVGLLSLVNAVQMLWKGEGAVLWKTLFIILAGTMLLMPLGYALLVHLSASNAAGLSIALGVVIMICSLPLARPIEMVARVAPLTSTFIFGAISGLMTGLFSAGGPPLVYHLYRQPLSSIAVRETLVTLFGLTQLARITIAGTQGGVNLQQFVVAGLTVPVVIGVTWFAKRYPLPLSTNALRKLVAGLLFASGVVLAVPPLIHLFGWI